MMTTQVVAYEFYNPSTGHAVLGYDEHTHVGLLTAAKGYVRRPLVYADDEAKPETQKPKKTQGPSRSDQAE